MAQRVSIDQILKKLDGKVDRLFDEVMELKVTVAPLPGAVARLERRVERMDQRLLLVEDFVIDARPKIDLIPAIMEVVSGQSDDLDDHERRLRRLERHNQI